MKDPLAFLSFKSRFLGISGLAGVALFSSFYLQYIAGYQPCIYCYVLRYLTVGILLLGLSGFLVPGWASDFSAALSAIGLIGSGVSAYLVANQLFPSARICTACSVTPYILGVSLYYYSLAFMAIVLGVPLTILASKGDQK